MHTRTHTNTTHKYTWQADTNHVCMSTHVTCAEHAAYNKLCQQRKVVAYTSDVLVNI